MLYSSARTYRVYVALTRFPPLVAGVASLLVRYSDEDVLISKAAKDFEYNSRSRCNCARNYFKHSLVFYPGMQ